MRQWGSRRESSWGVMCGDVTMALRDPVVVYTAASNLDAILACEMLRAADIDAHTVEDVSQVGTWMFGLLPGLHKPQVFVERADIEEAQRLLRAFERRRVEQQLSETVATIDVVCDECE